MHRGGVTVVARGVVTVVARGGARAMARGSVQHPLRTMCCHVYEHCLRTLCSAYGRCMNMVSGLCAQHMTDV